MLCVSILPKPGHVKITFGILNYKPTSDTFLFETELKINLKVTNQHPSLLHTILQFQIEIIEFPAQNFAKLGTQLFMLRQ